MTRVRITQTRSAIGQTQKHRGTLDKYIADAAGAKA